MERLHLTALTSPEGDSNLERMKKIVLGITLLFVLAVAMSSCKTHERCPAYGSVEQAPSLEDQA